VVIMPPTILRRLSKFTHKALVAAMALTAVNKIARQSVAPKAEKRRGRGLSLQHHV
jgi:hypothetical protein